MFQEMLFLRRDLMNYNEPKTSDVVSLLVVTVLKVTSFGVVVSVLALCPGDETVTCKVSVWNKVSCKVSVRRKAQERLDGNATQ